jgi:hypothetical protein
MIRMLVFFLFSISFVYAQVGEVRSVRIASDGWIFRNGTKLKLNEGMTLNVGDNIHTESSFVTLLLYPKIQICLVKGSELTLSQHLLDDGNEQTTSVIDFVKGQIRIQVTKDGSEKIDQQVKTRYLTVGVRGTEYEVLTTDQETEVDVFEGQVEVTSPNGKRTELVNPNQGLRIGKDESQFVRIPVRERVQDTRFLTRDGIRERWEKIKAERLVKKLEHERNNGLKDKKLQNVKDRVEKMLNRTNGLEEE